MSGNSNSGRKRLASADKKLRGNPGGRKIHSDEPQAKLYETLPEPPFWLGEYAVEAWERNGPILIDMYLLTEADLDLFATLCQAIHVMIESSKDINKNGMTIMGQRGRTRNPAIAAFTAATATIRSLTSEFGMSPSARTKLRMPGDNGGESLEDFLAGEAKDVDVD